ncbi:uncharacterized protein LOC122394453 [Amphibalanus amphitrite]|uniref:uncharacterized protein LOC122394453 n=1 Tax=Amphibalanus amphitrite TaxID=1232801 RepID=UPI001C92138A|nr:uncharacterized protein LOC122394453 [Amphibalanus amphitrite]
MSPNPTKGLRDLKGELKGLEVDEKLLDIMKKWNCLTEKQATELQETPMANRVDSMLSFLDGRRPRHWSLMICVFLELGRDELALKTWKAVQTQLRMQLNVTSSQRPDAMDFWDEFVRRMLAALVLDQHEKDREGVAGVPILSLPSPQKETASKIWKQIVNEAAAEKNKRMWMWKMLASHLAGAVKASRCKQNAIESQTIKEVWNILIDSTLKLLREGQRDRCCVMLRHLLESVRTVFDEKGTKFINDRMIEVCHEIQGKSQKTFVNDIRKMLIEHCRLLLEKDHQKAAKDAILHLIESTGTLVETMTKTGATKAALRLWKELIEQICGLPSKNKPIIKDELYRTVTELQRKGIDSQLLEGMRASIPSDSWPNTPPPKPSTKALVGSDPGRYRFKPGTTNLALVINNVDFIEKEEKRCEGEGRPEEEEKEGKRSEEEEKKKARRDGSEMDELALTFLLKRLGFHVKQMTNLTKDRLLEEISAFAKRPDHEDADAAVLAVMTHGVNEALEGHDRELLSFQSVIDCFCDENAPNLAGKPKWLIFQACRDKSEEDERKRDKPISEGGMSYSDMFVTYTALPGRKALRNNVQGAWYVHALEKAFDTSLCEFSLQEIHSEVLNNMLAMWNDDRCKEEIEQPTLDIQRLGWTKRLYFKEPDDKREVHVEPESFTSSATTRDRGCEATTATPSTSLCATADLFAVARTGECQSESGPDHHSDPYSGWNSGSHSSESGRSAPAESRGVEEAMRSPTPQNSGVGAKVDNVLQLLASISQEQHDFRTFVTSQFRALNDRLRELELRVGERDTQDAERSSPR